MHHQPGWLLVFYLTCNAKLMVTSVVGTSANQLLVPVGMAAMASTTSMP